MVEFDAIDVVVDRRRRARRCRRRDDPSLTQVGW